MFHAAGRKIYQRDEKDFVALVPEEAQKQGLTGKEIEVYRFEPVYTTIVESQPSYLGKQVLAKPGKIVAAFRGCESDRVSTRKLRRLLNLTL